MKISSGISLLISVLCLSVAACGRGSPGPGEGTAGGTGGGSAGGTGGGSAGGNGGGSAGGNGGGSAGGNGGGSAGGTGGGSAGGSGQAPGQVLADGGTCTASLNYGELDGGLGQTASYYVASGTDPINYEFDTFLNTDPAPDVLDMQLWNTEGVFANGIDAGTYTIAGAELQYSTCGLCLLIETDTDSSNNGQEVDQYFATGGTVTITSLQPTLAGTITNATFTHVNVDSSFHSTPVGDGCNSTVESMQFSVTVDTNPQSRAPAPRKHQP